MLSAYIALPIALHQRDLLGPSSGPIRSAELSSSFCARPLLLLLRLNGQVGSQQEFSNNSVRVQRLFVCEVAVSIAANRK